ncbi:MAG: hypothetical protein LUC41_07410 [Clostridiales bacterium]|nr:hypothetical protein [Clostridiales bacterium]
MAGKELRRMNRTELIEIIYALQQNEQALCREKDELAARLEEKKLCLDNAGSVAEAAIGLNHVFENAQSAADQYLFSLNGAEDKAAEILDNAQREAQKILDDANAEAARILEKAEKEAKSALALAREESEKASEYLSRAKKTRDQYERDKQEFDRMKNAFVSEAVDLLRKNPELSAKMTYFDYIEEFGE